MTTVSSTIDVAAGTDKVWPVLSEPAQAARWQTTHLGYAGTEPTAFTPGTSFVQKVRVMGMPADVSWTVAEVTEGSRLSMTGRGPMGITLLSSYDLEPTESGSRVRLSQEITGAAVAAVAGQLQREVKNAQEQSLAKLADAVS